VPGSDAAGLRAIMEERLKADVRWIFAF